MASDHNDQNDKSCGIIEIELLDGTATTFGTGKPGDILVRRDRHFLTVTHKSFHTETLVETSISVRLIAKFALHLDTEPER